MSKFIEELDRPLYRLVDSRGFADVECPLVGPELKYALDVQEKSYELQLFLRQAYIARQGSSNTKVEVPAWLKQAVREQDDEQSKPVTAQDSSKRLPGRPRKTD